MAHKKDGDEGRKGVKIMATSLCWVQKGLVIYDLLHPSKYLGFNMFSQNQKYYLKKLC